MLWLAPGPVGEGPCYTWTGIKQLSLGSSVFSFVVVAYDKDIQISSHLALVKLGYISQNFSESLGKYITFSCLDC